MKALLKRDPIRDGLAVAYPEFNAEYLVQRYWEDGTLLEQLRILKNHHPV